VMPVEKVQPLQSPSDVNQEGATSTLCEWCQRRRYHLYTLWVMPVEKVQPLHSVSDASRKCATTLCEWCQ